jgi:PAS domain S-box-containing protein
VTGQAGRSDRRRGPSGPLNLYGGPGVVVGVVLMVVLALVLALAVVRQAEPLERNAESTELLLDLNVRVLGQTQRELLRLRSLAIGPDIDPDRLELHRGFVLQRFTELRQTKQTQALREIDEYLARLDVLNGLFFRDIDPPLQRLIDGTSTDVAGDRRTVVDGLAEVELGYNDLTSWSEGQRRQLAGQTTAEVKRVLSSHRWLLAGEIASLLTIAVALVLSGRHFLRVDRERAEAAEATDELNNQLRTLSEVAARTANGVVITRADGTTEWVNDAFAELIGLRADELVGRRHWELIAWRPEHEVPRFEQALSSPVGSTWELPVNVADGSTVWTSVEVQPVRDADGTLTNAIVMYTDITAHQELEANLRRSALDAREAAEAKAGFLATMSHEIRTPLNAVIAMNELLLGTPLTDAQREYVEGAHLSGRVLLDIVNDILTYSAVEADHVQLEVRTFSLRQVLREVVDITEPQAREQQVELRHRVDVGLPDELRGDAVKLRQVLLNLVGNGIKFSTGGTVEVTVRRAGPGDDPVRVSFTIADDGIGIPADRLEHVFEPFTQVDGSVSRVFGGTGLGLAICRGLVRAMGGSIRLESADGEGTTVQFELPLGVERPGPGDAKDEGPGDPVPGVASLGVLVVEDDVLNQRVAALLLGRLGVTADVVSDGDEALHAVGQRRYDLVLMDVHMPVCDGVTATRRIRSTVPADRQPVIIGLTADVIGTDRVWLAESGMDACLTKPVSLADLASVLDRVAAQRVAGTAGT